MADAFGNPDESLLVGAHLALNLMIGLSDIPEAAHNSNPHRTLPILILID
jgi:hypothetical protein